MSLLPMQRSARRCVVLIFDNIPKYIPTFQFEERIFFVEFGTCVNVFGNIEPYIAIYCFYQ